MDNIVDLIRNAPVEQQQPTPTEKAQIVVIFSTPQQPLILRSNSVKKGERAYTKLIQAWSENLTICEVATDMFECTIDLRQVSAVCFVDHVRRNKFVPIP